MLMPLHDFSCYIHNESYMQHSCHAPNPGPTRSADPNQFPGCETKYWDSLPDFFFKTDLVPVGMAHILKQNQKNYHRSGVHQNLYTYTESYLQIQNCTFTITNQSTEPTCSEPLQVCWPSCMRMFADVFSCTYTN